MKRFFRIPACALLVLLPGCFSASLLEIDGLIPAVVNISPAIETLTVVSRCDLDSASKQSLVSAGRLADFNLDSMFSKQVVLGCSDALVESPRFDLFNPILRRNLADDFSDPSTKIPWNMIRSIAGDPPLDAVLSLEKGITNDTIGKSVQDGWLTYQYIVFVETYWRLYRLSDFQSADFTFTDTIDFEIDSPEEFASSPDNRAECIRNAMYEAGVQTAKKLAPWWTTFQRYYYSYGPYDFLGGADFLRQGKWKEAAEIFRSYAESRQKNLAAKACFNMALTCEMANNIPAAFDWLRKSEALGIPVYYIKEYQSTLAKRHVETEKLDEQMR